MPADSRPAWVGGDSGGPGASTSAGHTSTTVAVCCERSPHRVGCGGAGVCVWWWGGLRCRQSCPLLLLLLLVHSSPLLLLLLLVHSSLVVVMTPAMAVGRGGGAVLLYQAGGKERSWWRSGLIPGLDPGPGRPRIQSLSPGRPPLSSLTAQPHLLNHRYILS